MTVPGPAFNACLNAASAAFLVLGFFAIRGKRPGLHRVCMSGALCASTVFLASYLTYHAQAGSTRFTGVGWVRPVYFAILSTHTVLAVVILPMAAQTFRFAIKGDFARHRRWARWTFPLWSYVSISGVAVYLLLYG